MKIHLRGAVILVLALSATPTEPKSSLRNGAPPGPFGLFCHLKQILI